MVPRGFGELTDASKDTSIAAARVERFASANMNVMKIFIQLVALSICAQLIQHEQNHFTYSAPVHRLSYNVHRLGYNMKTPVLMRRAGSTICLLFASLSAAVPAYCAGADVPVFLRTSAGRLAGWVAADLDGDRHA